MSNPLDASVSVPTSRLEHTTIDGQPFLCIRHVDGLDPFLMNVVSSGNVWMFAGSNGGLTAGRRDPDNALFPYQTADKLLRHPQNSGALTVFQVALNGQTTRWEPWEDGQTGSAVSRNLYKHAFGASVVYEEVNHTLGLRFRWGLAASGPFGLVRRCTLENLTDRPISIRYLDGWRNLLPHGVNQEIYARYSYLAAAYMRHELLPGEGLSIHTLNSRITDRAEPSECLRVSCAWAVGHRTPTRLLCERQVEAFRQGRPVAEETEVRGEFGAYLVADSVELPPGGVHEWCTIADIGLDHSAVVALRKKLGDPEAARQELARSVADDLQSLKRRIAAADGLQQTADRAASLHHFANALFNCMRGGTFDLGYEVPCADFASFIKARNTKVHERHRGWLDGLPARVPLDELYQQAGQRGDVQLARLTREYLPLSFSRRHGDPSRPWNRFVIDTQDAHGQPLFSYQGNWRDIFQNWEGLAQSYPAYLGAMISVFLNASTADGYNPYRIARDGFDWEVHDPNDPWSHIGYWGDHQIVYLLRLLESHEKFWPGQLSAGLRKARYACALVPYEIAGFEALARDPRHTIRFDVDLHKRLTARAAEIGGDGRLLAGADGEAVLVSLAEKLLVPLLVKLSNLIPGGGIWMNTQRPEWNDANNALAGWGLSMVTVCHMRRYLTFVDRLFAAAGGGDVPLSEPVVDLLRDLTGALRGVSAGLDDRERYRMAAELGGAGERHRRAVYQRTPSQLKPVAVGVVRALIAIATQAVDSTIRENRRADGMYHSYNLLSIQGERASVERMHLMLEGQVAVLGSGELSAEESIALVKAMRASDLYREDQRSYLLYPDRPVAAFLSRNTLPANWRESAPALAELLAAGNRDVVVLDEEGQAHFNGDLTNAADLGRRLAALAADPSWHNVIERDREVVLALWEKVFHHSAFTGRSGTMFAFEGLGSIYWHMVAKLLLAVQECYGSAGDTKQAKALAHAYHHVRGGLGFTKTPTEYGAFPTDPYSHTPRHRGAQQPGMTGQVKEELLTRLGELGVEVRDGCLTFAPQLLSRAEFAPSPHSFAYVDIDGADQTWDLPANSLAFTVCQTPVCYVAGEKAGITIHLRDSSVQAIDGRTLPPQLSQEVFRRTGRIASITVTIPQRDLVSSATP